jgi:hypothetical protein
LLCASATSFVGRVLAESGGGFVENSSDKSMCIEIHSLLLKMEIDKSAYAEEPK